MSASTFWLLMLGPLLAAGLVLVAWVTLWRVRMMAVRGAAIATTHVGPVADRASLKGTGRLYVVQIGEHKAAYSVEDLAAWLRVKYGLDVQVLPSVEPDRSTWNASRKQYVAELLFAQLKRDHPEVAGDPNAYIIGFTDAGMYSVRNDWDYSFTQRDMQRMAVISAQRMGDQWLDRWRYPGLATEHLQARLRRILLKDVAILYWHLPLNNDPSSVLRDTLDPDVPTEDIFESDLEPARTQWGQSLGEPCVFFSYTAADGMKPLPGDLIRSCSDTSLPVHEEGRELFELDLRLGLLIVKHTDFELPDAIPIEFQRATQQGWSGTNPFGASGSDNYDQYLSSDDNVTIRVIHNDGGRDELVRQPRWLPYLPMVKYVDTGSGRFFEMTWHGTPFEHYDLKRYDGAVETYLPCEGQVFCYLTGYRDAQGLALLFRRDEFRRLVQLTSPNQSWLRLTYGPANHIAEIDDSRGRDVRYGYDGRNRLTSVSYPSGEALHYEYDDQQHLLAVSVSPDATTAPKLLLRNEYMNGRVVRQTLANGEVYAYGYDSAGRDSVRAAVVRAPGGRIFQAMMTEGGSVLFEGKEVSNSTIPRDTPLLMNHEPVLR